MVCKQFITIVITILIQIICIHLNGFTYTGLIWIITVIIVCLHALVLFHTNNFQKSLWQIERNIRCIETLDQKGPRSNCNETVLSTDRKTAVTANWLKSQNGTLFSHVWRRGRLALDPLQNKSCSEFFSQAYKNWHITWGNNLWSDWPPLARGSKFHTITHPPGRFLPPPRDNVR